MPQKIDFQPIQFEPIQNNISFEPIAPPSLPQQSQPGFLSRLYDQGKGLLEFGKSMGDWPSAMTQGAQTGYNLANDTWNYLKNPQTAIDALKFERNPMSKEAMQIGLKNPGTKFGLGTIGADANAIGEDLGNNNYSGLAADIGGPAVLGIAAHKLGGFTPGEKLPEVLPAEFKSQRLLNGKVPLPDVEVPAREVAQLSAGPDAPLQLPALGETTNNQAPRFYAGDLGLVDANRRYPIDLTDKSKVGLRASEFDFPEQAPPELNLQNGDTLPTSRTIQTAGLDSPTMLPGDIDASLGERNPIDVAAQGNRAPLKAYDPTDIFGWHGTPLDPRRSANIPVSLSMPETPAPTLEQPLGGRIINPPAAAQLSPDQPFRTNTLVGDEASAFRGPVTTPKEFPKMFDPNARIETKGNTLNLSPEQTRQLAAAPDITPLGPVDKLKAALDQSGPLNKQQRLIYAQERAKRLAALDAQPITNQAEYKAQRAKLAGEYQKVQNEPLKLDQADIDNLYKMIAEHPAAIGFNKVHAGDALAKMLSGGVPTNSEIGILRKIFGGDLPTPKMTAFQKGSTAIGRVRNIVKTMMTGEDLSWPLRQGLPMISRPEWWSAQKNNMAFFSKEYAKGAQAAIESKPTFPLQQESGLRLSDPETGSAGEGYFVDKLVNMIPGMPGSKRAYAAVSNKVKSDVWDTLYKGLEAGGYDPANNPLLQKQISSYVNNATGSGGLGALEKHADLLNKIFFAPRKIAADLKLLNPVTYVAQENPMIRQAYLRSLFGIAAAGTTALGLGKLGGADVETDPHSADFGKVKFGNTRFDPWGGKQQYIVAAARLLPDMLGGGEMKSSTTGKEYQLGSRYGLPTRFDIGVNFLNSKADPLVSFATTLLRGKDMNGNPVEVAPEIAARFTPMVMQDTYQMFQNNPELLPVGIPAAIFGMGAQSYGKPTPYGNFRQ